VPWPGRIQAGLVDIARKKSFILGKGKIINCSTRKKGFCTWGQGEGWFISGQLYTTLNLEAGRD
jgi:hypothetical protein